MRVYQFFAPIKDYKTLKVQRIEAKEYEKQLNQFAKLCDELKGLSNDPIIQKFSLELNNRYQAIVKTNEVSVFLFLIVFLLKNDSIL